MDTSSDTINEKLITAGEQFQSCNYAGCLSTLSSCPSEDPKISHNTALVRYILNGDDKDFEVLKALQAIPGCTSTLDGKDHSDNALVGDFCYDGHEIAHYNRAVVLLHNGLFDDAVAILRNLLNRAPAVDPIVRIRTACLLQLATSGGRRDRKLRTSEDDAAITKVISETASIIVAHPVLKNLIRLAFAGNSDLHEWFQESGKTAHDKMVYYVNLGVLSLNDSKPNLAALYLQRALEQVEEAKPGTIALNSLYYNCGMCALRRRDYEGALKFLLLCQNTMLRSVVLWMRIAQCAVGLHMKFASEAAIKEYTEGQNRLAESFAKTGRLPPGFQFLQLPSTLSFYGDEKNVNANKTMELGFDAISNVLVLLIPQGENLFRAADILHETDQNNLYRVYQYALTYMVFLELCRCNYVVAAAIGQELLKLHKKYPLLPDVLASVICYTVEALIMTNKVAHALQVFQSVNVADLLEGEAGVSPESQRPRIEAVFINLVTAHIANESWKAAQSLGTNLISKIAAKGNDPKTSSGGGYNNIAVARCASILQIYVEVAQGNKEKALELLRINPVSPPTF